jgi:hypothetical protein
MALDLNKRVIIENLCNWKVGFRRINTIGDVSLAPKAKIPLDISEIISQCYNNNKLFMGTDNAGSHAMIYIHDKDVRIEIGLESEDSITKQFLVTDEVLKELFEIKTIAAFKKAVQEKILSHAEKNAIIEYIKKHKVNDHQKITFVEEYTGFSSK